MQQRLAGEKPEDQQRGAAEVSIAAADVEHTCDIEMFPRALDRTARAAGDIRRGDLPSAQSRLS